MIPSMHHVGFVVESIDRAARDFGLPVCLHWDGKVFEDPVQAVRVTFLSSTVKMPAPKIELVEPMGSASPVASFLKAGGGLHHVCYEVDDIDEHLRTVRSQGALPIANPTPAVAFAGHRIAWVYTRERLLVEFLER